MGKKIKNQKQLPYRVPDPDADPQQDPPDDDHRDVHRAGRESGAKDERGPGERDRGAAPGDAAESARKE